jgi:hypothetical protein
MRVNMRLPTTLLGAAEDTAAQMTVRGERARY